MKFQIPPTLRMRDLPLTLLPALFWLLAVYARGPIITPHCAEHPDRCTESSLWPVDRPAMGLEVRGADALSFFTQGMSGVLALSIPPLWNAGLAITGRVTPMGALVATGVDLAIFAQTASWNGLLTETSHLISQRARPFAYVDPVRARDFSNYTSFYSGHTSFSAAAMVCLLLTLMSRGANGWVLGAASASAYVMVSFTGMFRVLAGRHFPTDVAVGALVGACVAFIVAYLHRTPPIQSR